MDVPPPKELESPTGSKLLKEYMAIQIAENQLDRMERLLIGSDR